MNNEALSLLLRIDAFFWPPDPALPQEAALLEEVHEYVADNYDPTPYCSYGHMRAADCDCGADNE